MDNLKKNQFLLDSAGLFCIGIFSLGYIVIVRPFAELNIQLPFLNFPIFIGEILLLICLCLFVLKGNVQLNKKHYWIIGYFVFVIVKALYGYVIFGPLALRDAALFYYPAFIIFAISFYRRNFFDYEKGGLIIAIIVFLFVSQLYDGYWLLTCISLALILSYTYPIKTIRYLLFGTLFLTIPYVAFFATSRMMLLANFVTSIYLVIGLFLILKVKKPIKIGIVVLGVFLIVLMFFRFSDKNALLAIVRADKIIEVYQLRDGQYKAIHAKIIPPIPGTYLADSYVPGENEIPHLYNSNIANKFKKNDNMRLEADVQTNIAMYLKSKQASEVVSATSLESSGDILAANAEDFASAKMSGKKDSW